MEKKITASNTSPVLVSYWENKTTSARVRDFSTGRSVLTEPKKRRIDRGEGVKGGQLPLPQKAHPPVIFIRADHRPLFSRSTATQQDTARSSDEEKRKHPRCLAVRIFTRQTESPIQVLSQTQLTRHREQHLRSHIYKRPGKAPN